MSENIMLSHLSAVSDIYSYTFGCSASKPVLVRHLKDLDALRRGSGSKEGR